MLRWRPSVLFQPAVSGRPFIRPASPYPAGITRSRWADGCRGWESREFSAANATNTLLCGNFGVECCGKMLARMGQIPHFGEGRRQRLGRAERAPRGNGSWLAIQFAGRAVGVFVES